MAENNFKPFAVGAGANVLTQTEWEALVALSTGFTAGIARSGEVNKALRQATVMASVLAQYIADTSDSDVLDDGDVSALVVKLKTALNSIIPSIPVTSVNNKTGDVILGAGDVGAYPATGGQLDGSLDATGQITEAGQRVYSPNNPPTTASILQNGWVKDAATGLIRQWALVSSTDPKYVHLTLPIAFPNAVLNVQNTVLRTAAAGRGADNWSSVYGATLSGVYVGTDEYGSYVEAIGY